jgi:ketosteroid isomerase-like protein
MNSTYEKELALKLGSAYANFNEEQLANLLDDSAEWALNKTFAMQLAKTLPKVSDAGALNKQDALKLIASRKQNVSVSPEEERPKIEVIAQDGDTVVVAGRMNFTFNRAHNFDEDFMIVCQIKDKKITRVQVFEDTAKILRTYSTH